MAIQVVFSKSDDAPWGFRLTGGADCEIPLTVIKIAEGGIADAAGLQVDDVVIKINDFNAEYLSHIEAHDVLMEAGQNFTMTITRNHVNHIHDDEHHNEEVTNILHQSFPDENEQHCQREAGADQNGYTENISNIECVSETPTKQNILRVHFDDFDLKDSEVTEETKQHNKVTQEVQEKKWSTFLQKPSRPVLSPKKIELEKPAAEQYRVIIKKQPKKIINKIEEVCFAEKQIDTETQDNVLETFEQVEKTLPEEEIEEEIAVEFTEADEEEEPIDIEDVYENNENDLQEITHFVEEVELEKHVSLEEQLAQIQQQLQSLAQVPTSIQDTLEVLTEQLAKIVGVSQSQQHLEEQEVSYGENEDEEDVRHSYDDDNLPAISEEIAEALDSTDEYKLDQTDTTDISEDEDERNSQSEHEEIDLYSPEYQLQLKQAEEAEKLELEKFVKQERTEEFHQRRLEQRPTVPLAPVQRPIILPGGRKWSEPNDALPKPRKSKMTDEKICETLDNYSEIVTGHTKGINFLKYQPAPKNLDYLKRSEVFRLIHDTDPPKSGIAARSGMIVSEEDYYKNNFVDAEQRTSVKA